VDQVEADFKEIAPTVLEAVRQYADDLADLKQELRRHETACAWSGLGG